MCKRIDALVEHHLQQLRIDPSGWDGLYRDPTDYRLWELTYPTSHMHGGGPPELRVLSAYDAISKYCAGPTTGALITVYELDGSRFQTLEEFYLEVSRVLIPDAKWGHNLDAFRDILHGGFGTSEEGFTIRWKNHKLSRQRLGYLETVRQLELKLLECHSSARESVAAKLSQARAGEGPTVFDWLVEIISEFMFADPQDDYRVHLVLD